MLILIGYFIIMRMGLICIFVLLFPAIGSAQSSNSSENASYCVGVLSADDEYKIQIISSAQKLIDHNKSLLKELETEIQYLDAQIDAQQTHAARAKLTALRNEKNNEINDTISAIKSYTLWKNKIEFERKNFKPQYDYYIAHLKDILRTQSYSSPQNSQKMNNGRNDHKICTDYINNFCNQDFAIAHGGPSKPKSLFEYQKCANEGICKQVNTCLTSAINK